MVKLCKGKLWLGTLATGLILGLLALAATSKQVQESSPWQTASLVAPLGYDEFSRNLVATLVAATLMSIAKALLIATTLFLLALAVGQFISLTRHRVLSSILQFLVDTIESIPAMLWVLAIFAALREPRLLLVGLVFGLITLPTAIGLTVAEIDRLRKEPFVEVAYSLGLSEWTVALRHILPNTTAVLLPFAMQVAGAALAVDGAVGIVGLGNRSDMDLGVFLLRGKENFNLHPILMISTLIAYALIYSGIAVVDKKLRGWLAAY